MAELDRAITTLAQQAVIRKKENERTQRQRRNQVVDTYGMEHTSQGDETSPATFFVSISPDLIYYERFEFKLVIEAFRIPLKTGTSGSVPQTEPVTLEIVNGKITPNPHTHEITAGITLDGNVGQTFELFIDGINLTEAFKQQYNGHWVTGTGIFPETSNGLGNYDVLKAIEYLPEWQRGVVLKPGFKKIEVRGKGVFHATLINYLKYSHVNR